MAAGAGQAGESSATADGLEAIPDLFIWPPASGADEPITLDIPSEPTPDAPQAPHHPRRSQVLATLASIEHDLLGVRSLSFARWARATEWTPDGFGAFCWRCAESVGPYETDGTGCGSCREKRLAWDRALRLGVYDDGVRTAVTELKFGRWRRTGVEIGRAMGRRLAESMAAGGFGPDEVVLVPIPASWRRRMQRGIDHTAVLARAAADEAGVRVVRGLARRHTPTQVGLSATARAANIRGAFHPRPGLEQLVEPASPGRGTRRAAPDRIRAVVIVDDVRTTGATMTAACRAVRAAIRGAAGARIEVWSLVAAVASQRRSGGNPG